MRILFLGNANSPLINNLARELRDHHPDFTVDIISDSLSKFEGVNESFNTIVQLDDSKWYRKARFIRILGHAWQCRKALRRISIDEYDFVHIFFLYPSYGLLRNRLRRARAALFISVFGSEYYLTSSLEKKLQGRLTRVADKVIASNKNTLRDFCNHYSVPGTKQHIRLFGLKSLDYIKPFEERTHEECKVKLGLSTHAKIIACGYNASRIQNHLEIIEELKKGKSLLPENIVLLVPMTIGGTKEYIEEVRSALVASGFDFRLYDKFMSSEEIATIRQATDVMIQVQKSDQLSGAMLEHMYAENALITGSWLPYDFLDDNKMFYYKVDSLNHLPEKIAEVFHALPATSIQRLSNRKVIWENCGWLNAQQKWASLYIG